MNIKSFTIVLFILALLGSTSLYGQISESGQRQPQNPRNRPGQNNQQGPDSTRTGRPGSILDDSTRAIYGPKTTLQLYENDILDGTYREQRIDTTIQNMHNQRFWFQDTAYYQQLGNIGTAAKPMLYQLPNRIGVRLGKNAFDRYAYDPQTINYFDTRSPYSHLYYVQGQRGEQVFEVIYARNITSRFNFGVAYKIVAADKQIGSSNLRDDGQIDNQAVKVFSHYSSKNDKYDLFLNYTHLNHEQVESGGVKPLDADDTPDSLFRYENDLVYLDQAATNEMRHKFHLLHMFKVSGENLKAYHRLDWGRQKSTFSDDRIPRLETGAIDFYPNTYYSNLRTKDRTNYRELENEFGLTGNTKISFYKAYVKQRNGKINYSAIQTITPDTNAVLTTIQGTRADNHIFVGGEARLFYQDKYWLTGIGEYQLADNYILQASAKAQVLEFTQTRIRQSPSFMEQRVISNHFYWNNDFKTTITDQSKATLQHQFSDRLFLRLMGAYTNISRIVVYGTDAQPVQISENQKLLEARFENHLRLGGFHLENFIHYTNTDNASAIRIPELLINSKLYYQGHIFKQALYGQIGVELNMPTAYQPDAWMPVTQQFYLQNVLTTKNYPVFDVFLNADIKTVNVFVKMAHVNYGIWEPGYFETPGYPGLRRSFTFGLKWMFFD